MSGRPFRLAGIATAAGAFGGLFGAGGGTNIAPLLGAEAASLVAIVLVCSLGNSPRRRDSARLQAGGDPRG